MRASWGVANKHIRPFSDAGDGVVYDQNIFLRVDWLLIHSRSFY